MLCKLCKCVLVYRSLLPVDNWLEICLKIMSFIETQHSVSLICYNVIIVLKHSVRCMRLCSFQ